MVKKCCIIGCRSNYNVQKGESSTTAFQFPRDETLRELWIDSIGRTDGWMPTVFSYVCVKHFAEDDVKQRNRRQVLQPDAVPRIFPEITPETLKGVRLGTADDSVLDTSAGGGNNTTADADDESDEYEAEYLDEDEDGREDSGDVVRW
jgi:THAP domain